MGQLPGGRGGGVPWRGWRGTHRKPRFLKSGELCTLTSAPDHVVGRVSQPVKVFAQPHGDLLQQVFRLFCKHN